MVLVLDTSKISGFFISYVFFTNLFTPHPNQHTHNRKSDHRSEYYCPASAWGFVVGTWWYGVHGVSLILSLIAILRWNVFAIAASSGMSEPKLVLPCIHILNSCRALSSENIIVSICQRLSPPYQMAALETRISGVICVDTMLKLLAIFVFDFNSPEIGGINVVSRFSSMPPTHPGP